MSEYVDFEIEFPARCLEILKTFKKEATKKDLEVTLLLMTAATAFVIPHERLGPNHPSGNKAKFEEIIKDYGRKFRDSSFFKLSHNDWKCGDFNKEDFNSGPDEWIKDSHSASDQHLNYILAIIRNAFAHGNIYTKGTPIEHLVFVSEKRANVGSDKAPELIGYKYLKVSVCQFEKFLFLWVEKLKDLGGFYSNAIAAIEFQTKS